MTRFTTETEGPHCWETAEPGSRPSSVQNADLDWNPSTIIYQLTDLGPGTWPLRLFFHL